MGATLAAAEDSDRRPSRPLYSKINKVLDVTPLERLAKTYRWCIGGHTHHSRSRTRSSETAMGKVDTKKNKKQGSGDASARKGYA